MSPQLKRHFPWVVHVVICWMLVASFILPFAAQAQPGAAPEPQELPLVFTALDSANDKPIAGMQAKVTTSSGTLGIFDTDEKGQANIVLPPGLNTLLTISTTSEGYPPYTIRWQPQAKIATNYVFKVEKGAPLGGIARDEEGAPIEGLKLTIALSRPTPPAKGGERLNLSGHLEITDHDGKWSCSHIPKDLVDQLNFLNASHPDFLPTSFTSDTKGRAEAIHLVSVADLTAAKAVLVIKSGIQINAVVTRPDGKPVENVAVLLGEKVGLTKRLEYTDAEGKVRFRNSPEGASFLTLQTDGLAPELQTVEVRRGMPEIKIQLAKGKQLKGRVLDPTGAPAADTQVVGESWRDHRTLEWQTVTDPDGRFQWDSAPADPVTFAVNAPGLLPLRATVSADGTEHVFRLHKTASIAGKVTDAMTGEPVGDLTVSLGRESGVIGATIRWEEGFNPSPGRGRGRGSAAVSSSIGIGKFSFELNPYNLAPRGGSSAGPAPAQTYRIKVQAPGYLPQISGAIRSDGSADTMLDFQLVKGIGPTGVVLGVDGRPQADVQVVLNSPTTRASIGKRRFINNGAIIVRTDSVGRFAIPANADATTLVAIHANGFAEVPIESISSNRPVQLLAWGRIAGRFKVGTNTVAGETLTLTGPTGRDGLAIDSNEFQTATDHDGRFVLDGVPPGEQSVVHRVPMPGNAWTFSNPIKVMVEPGATAQVSIGGAGRPIIGKAKLSDPSTPVDWSLAQLNMSTRPPTRPQAAASAAENIAWLNSPEYQAAFKNRRTYAAQIKSDGSFRLDDIPAGEYQLVVSVRAAIGDPGGSYSSGIGGKPIGVPEMPGSRSDEPLDVGIIEIRGSSFGRNGIPSAALR